MNIIKLNKSIIMKPIKQHLHNKLNKFLWLLTLGGLGAFILLMNFAIDFANIALVFFICGIGFSLLRIWDLLFMPKLDTQTEIKKGSVAYAITFLGACIIIGSSILAIFG